MRAVYLLRHLLSIALLPFTVAVLVPLWIARRPLPPLVSATAPAIARGLEVAGGALLAAIGLALFVSSLRRFATEGDGTLAPWDPPRRLVVRGPYRYVRNPMISGVVFMVFAEGLLVNSRPHLAWAVTFLALNLVYIPLFEEPQLAQRFGESYANYQRHVPRMLPRLRPWEPDRSAQ